MNSWEIYKQLEKLDTLDIMNVICASVVYLVKSRKVDCKELIKRIKFLNKKLCK